MVGFTATVKTPAQRAKHVKLVQIVVLLLTTTRARAKHHIEEKLCPQKFCNKYLSFFFYKKLCNTYLVGVSVVCCLAVGIAQTLHAWACERVCYWDS